MKYYLINQDNDLIAISQKEYNITLKQAKTMKMVYTIHRNDRHSKTLDLSQQNIENQCQQAILDIYKLCENQSNFGEIVGKLNFLSKNVKKVL